MSERYQIVDADANLSSKELATFGMTGRKLVHVSPYLMV